MNSPENQKEVHHRTPGSPGHPVSAVDRDAAVTKWSYDFTVFIPTYNRAYVLERTLDSVAQQSYRNLETLIIDDGSTDGTTDLIRSLEKKFDFPIVYHWQRNQGGHAAHNRAIMVAKGKFFIRLDSNDAVSRLNRGVAYKLQGNKVEAATDLEKAITLSDESKLIEMARKQLKELSR